MLCRLSEERTASASEPSGTSCGALAEGAACLSTNVVKNGLHGRTKPAAMLEMIASARNDLTFPVQRRLFTLIATAELSRDFCCSGTVKLSSNNPFCRCLSLASAFEPPRSVHSPIGHLLLRALRGSRARCRALNTNASPLPLTRPGLLDLKLCRLIGRHARLRHS